MKLFFIPFIIFIGLIILLAKGLNNDPSYIPSALIGKKLPEFSLNTLHNKNKEISSEDLIGEPFLLNVWATWCAACREEHEFLVDIAKRSKITIYGLNYKDDKTAALQWLETLGNPYKESLYDSAGNTAIDWGVYGAPETFLVDEHGMIKFKYIGLMNEEIYQEMIKKLYDE